jgi:hypothetical protein
MRLARAEVKGGDGERLVSSILRQDGNEGACGVNSDGDDFLRLAALLEREERGGFFQGKGAKTAACESIQDLHDAASVTEE